MRGDQSTHDAYYEQQEGGSGPGPGGGPFMALMMWIVIFAFIYLAGFGIHCLATRDRARESEAACQEISLRKADRYFMSSEEGKRSQVKCKEYGTLTDRLDRYNDFLQSLLD